MRWPHSMDGIGREFHHPVGAQSVSKIASECCTCCRTVALIPTELVVFRRLPLKRRSSPNIFQLCTSLNRFTES